MIAAISLTATILKIKQNKNCNNRHITYNITQRQYE